MWNPPSSACSAVVEDLAQLRREGLRLTGLAELAAEEPSVVAGEEGCLLAQSAGGRDGRASGK
jgi:hypothetical protein